MKNNRSLGHFLGLALLFCVISLVPSQLRACDVCVSDEVNVKTYDVQGKSLRDLRAAMAKRGPSGFWAYTTTNWSWDRRCNMTFWADITMPKLIKREELSTADLQVWDNMVAALMDHEMEHVAIGRAWATEIKQAECKRDAVRRINAKYDNADEELDARTKHGATTGVTLRR